eukprot:scaffold248380_cov51-Cyclotella_meneghiniana.AAC.5
MILCCVSPGTGSLFTRRHAVATSRYTVKLIHSTPYRSDAANQCKSARLLVSTLGQNSTLLLRSKSLSLSQIQIVPQWRDDTLLELVPDTDEEPNITDISTATAESSGIFGGVQFTFHKDGIDTSMGRVGSFVEVDLLDNADNRDGDDSPWKLIATVPEKCNITCQIANGDINVDGKLEGDVHLSTSKYGNIIVGKLRGHNVTLSNTNQIEGAADVGQNKGLIHIKKAIEAKTVHINSSQRVRARMMNGSNIQIQVKPSTMFTCSKLDEDDEGAIIDTPLVDLGGVNGSCDVLLEAFTSSDFVKQTSVQERSVASRIHFDAFAPESISTITSRGNAGGTSITIDRKLDAELRLLSMAKSNTTMSSNVDAHSITSDECEDVNAVLRGLDEHLSQCITKQAFDNDISIETDAFQMSDDTVSSSLSRVQYLQGTVKNRSGEPDSRFDIQSRGKINKDGAALQALHGFHSKTAADGIDDDNSSQHPSVVLPLLSVVTDSTIKLETLSWLGSIARRYGLEENKKIPLGRQASRKSSDRVNFLTKK